MLDYNLASIASQLGSTMNRKKTRIRLRRLNEQYAPTCGSKAPLPVRPCSQAKTGPGPCKVSPPCQSSLGYMCN